MRCFPPLAAVYPRDWRGRMPVLWAVRPRTPAHGQRSESMPIPSCPSCPDELALKSGRLCQGAPVRIAQRMPFKTSRGSRHGRPRASGRQRSLGRVRSCRRHCASVRSTPHFRRTRLPTYLLNGRVSPSMNFPIARKPRDLGPALRTRRKALQSHVAAVARRSYP